MRARLPRELYAARELIELRLLAVALDALVTALRLEHATLEVLAEPTDPPTLLAARRLVVQVRSLRSALRAPRLPYSRSRSLRVSWRSVLVAIGAIDGWF
jgi:hypothetical protein